MRKLSILLITLIITFFIFASCKTPQTVPSVAVADPEFSIESIVILQADLVNTQFEAVLKIVNPNNFDLYLTSIQYELYGNGMFWAKGSSMDVAEIPAESSVNAKYRFSMNFIDMNRRLLDDVINMKKVQYIFTGQAQIKTGAPGAGAFTAPFNISGLSEVKPKAD